MLRIALLFVLVIHGLIHLMGLVKAFEWATLAQFTKAIARPVGLLWGLAALLFLVAAFLVFRHSDRWWAFALPAVLLSQVLVSTQWHDARWGTVANALILVAAVAGAAVWNFRSEYHTAMEEGLDRVDSRPGQRITEQDLQPLPAPVQRFLRKAGVVGKTRPRSMQLEFKGDIRAEGGPWMPFTTVQVNTFDPPARFFWMDATMKGLPTKGLHAYDDGTAFMRIKLLGLFPVVDISGRELDQAETVTWFNDLCLFAPAALVDPRITWTEVEDRSALATFTHKDITIGARLVFDAQDLLVDFISDDRYIVAPPKPPEKRTFRTPASSHRMMNGLLLPGYGEALWELPGGPFTYGRFTLTALAYDADR